MKAEEIRRYLAELDDELRDSGVKGEICIYGGAAMCLAFDARPATKDVDAVFRPTREIREAAERVARVHGLRPDWLNDAVKGFVVPHPRRVLFEFPNLSVYAPEPDYLLAMKALAARADGTDRGDVELLIKSLGLGGPEEVFAILEKYYPRRRVRPATQFFIEELFGR